MLESEAAQHQPELPGVCGVTIIFWGEFRYSVPYEQSSNTKVELLHVAVFRFFLFFRVRGTVVDRPPSISDLSYLGVA